MFERKECPECGEWNSERVFVDWTAGGVEETRVCNDCPTQYTINYGDPVVTDVHTDD